MEQRNRKTYLDALRVLAGFFVVFNHVAGQDMRLLSGMSGAAALFMLYVSKSAIPLFLLVTGVTLLPRTEPYGKTARRAGRIALMLLLTSLFYYGVECLHTGAPFVPGDFARILFRSQASNSLWYLYAYLGLLMMLPILSRMTAAFTKREYRYFILWTLLFGGGMPMLTTLLPALACDSAFNPVIFGGIIGMPVLGRYIDSHVRFSKCNTALAIALPILIAAASVAATMRAPTLFALFDNAFLLPAMVTACSIAYLAKLADGRRVLPGRLSAAVSHMARLVFAAYLVSDFLIARLQFLRETLIPLLRVNGAGAAYVLIIWIAGLLVAEVLTRIPGLKTLL